MGDVERLAAAEERRLLRGIGEGRGVGAVGRPRGGRADDEHRNIPRAAVFGGRDVGKRRCGDAVGDQRRVGSRGGPADGGRAEVIDRRRRPGEDELVLRGEVGQGVILVAVDVFKGHLDVGVAVVDRNPFGAVVHHRRDVGEGALGQRRLRQDAAVLGEDVVGDGDHQLLVGGEGAAEGAVDGAAAVDNGAGKVGRGNRRDIGRHRNDGYFIKIVTREVAVAVGIAGVNARRVVADFEGGGGADDLGQGDDRVFVGLRGVFADGLRKQRNQHRHNGNFPGAELAEDVFDNQLEGRIGQHRLEGREGRRDGGREDGVDDSGEGVDEDLFNRLRRQFGVGALVKQREDVGDVQVEDIADDAVDNQLVGTAVDGSGQPVGLEKDAEQQRVDGRPGVGRAERGVEQGAVIGARPVGHRQQRRVEALAVGDKAFAGQRAVGRIHIGHFVEEISRQVADHEQYAFERFGLG
ncbi:MAG: hypothetical protein BWY37_01859 [Firmicutes bacterium ADurb.Bin262]|nr:MAG: hypothetical protein BWY37_01859 [Firmicutes bacterium ADurb.Bin262]